MFMIDYPYKDKNSEYINPVKFISPLYQPQALQKPPTSNSSSLFHSYPHFSFIFYQINESRKIGKSRSAYPLRFLSERSPLLPILQNSIATYLLVSTAPNISPI